MGKWLSLALVLALGCEVPLTEGAYSCTSDDECPTGWFCWVGVDDRCWSSAMDAGSVDAGAIDAGAIDARAEDAGPADAATDTGMPDTGVASDAGPPMPACCTDSTACGASTWALGIETPSGDISEMWDVALDDEGFTYVSGTARDTEVSIGGTSVPRGGFVARLAPDGSLCWLTPMPFSTSGGAFNEVTDLALSPDHAHVFFVGGLAGSSARTEIAGVTIAGASNYVGRARSADGVVEWVRPLLLPRQNDSATSRAIAAMAVDARSVYLAGVYRGPILFPGTETVSGDMISVASRTNDGGVLLRLDASNGEIGWVGVFGASSPAEARGVAVESGNVVVVGEKANQPIIRMYRSHTDTSVEVLPSGDQRTYPSTGYASDVLFDGCGRFVVFGQTVGELDVAPRCSDPGDSLPRPFLAVHDVTTMAPATDSGSVFLWNQVTDGRDLALAGGDCASSVEILVAGTLSEEMLGLVTSGAGDRSPYVARLDIPAAGRETARWASVHSARNPTAVQGLAASGARVVVVGNYSGPLPFNGCCATPGASRNGFVVSNAGFAGTDVTSSWRVETACP